METIVNPMRNLSANLNVLTVAQQESNDYIDLLQTFPYRPTLFLGLGGTGCRAVAKVKLLFEKAFKNAKGQEGLKEVIPSMYAFRAFDTSDSEKQPGLDKNREWFFLGMNDVRSFLKHQGGDPFYKPWLAPGLNEIAITNGCRGYRNLGRLALMGNMDTFSKAIDSAKLQIVTHDPRMKISKPIVYVFCSLAGGTGSGMLMDACFYIARNFPEAVRVGLIAIMEGLPTMADMPRYNVKLGVFAALKELNMFMSGNVPEECTSDNDGDFSYPLGKIAGTYVPPFHHCYLQSSKTVHGAENLQSAEQLTSFMSRCAFVMSAYSPKQKDADTTPDFTGIMNNREAELLDKSSGAHTCYIVPGLAQIHFPMDEVVDWTCCKAAADFLRYIKGGTAYDGDKDASLFADSQKLRVSALTEHVARDEGEAALSPRKYDDEVRKRLVSEKVRFSPQGKELLAHGDAMPTTRLAEREADMRPSAEKILRDTKDALSKKVVSMLMADDFLYMGTQDFLQDLKNNVSLELSILQKRDQERIGFAYDDISRRWTALRKLVNDVVTKGSLIAKVRKSMSVDRCRDHLIAFLNESEQIVFERAQNNAAAFVFTSLIEEIDQVRAKLKRLYEVNLEGAVTILEEKRNDIASNLLVQERGKGETPENICSINVLTQEVREKLLLSHQNELSPQALLGRLSRSEWNPLIWLEVKTDVVKGATSERLVAQDVLNRVSPELDHWRNWELGQVLDEAQQLRGKKPIQYIAEQLYSGGVPQMMIYGMKNVLKRPTTPTFIIGGISDLFRDELLKLEQFAGLENKLKSAETYEKNRITVFAAHIPVAAAGMDDLRNVFKASYNKWLDDMSKMEKNLRESQIGLFHCFPNSVNWPDPTEPSGPIPEETALFAKAMAISEILEVDPSDLEHMNAKPKGPKEKRYALSRIGQAAFWLWPFFAPYQGAAVKDEPINLGTNVFKAHQKFKESREYQGAARKWVEWYMEHWSDRFASVQAREQLQAALNRLPTSSGDENCKKLWKQIQTALEAWAAQF